MHFHSNDPNATSQHSYKWYTPKKRQRTKQKNRLFLKCFMLFFVRQEISKHKHRISRKEILSASKEKTKSQRFLSMINARLKLIICCSKETLRWWCKHKEWERRVGLRMATTSDGLRSRGSPQSKVSKELEIFLRLDGSSVKNFRSISVKMHDFLWILNMHTFYQIKRALWG